MPKFRLFPRGNTRLLFCFMCVNKHLADHAREPATRDERVNTANRGPIFL
jgi:hypothetical protein